MMRSRIKAYAVGAAIAALMAVLTAPNFIAIRDTAGHIDVRVTEGVGYAAMFWLVAAAILPRLWHVCLLGAISLLWLPIEIFVRVYYAQAITVNLLGFLVDTDLREIREFSSVYQALVLWPMVLLQLPVLWLLYVLKKEKLSWRHRTRSWVLAVSVLSILMLAFAYHGATDPENNSAPSGSIFESQYSLYSKLRLVYPLDFPLSAIAMQHDHGEVARERAQSAGYTFGAKLKDDSPDVVVMIIGESSRINHWGMFGYIRNTTPNLSKRNDLIAFPNVVTYSTATRTAVPSLVSRSPAVRPDGKIPESPEPSVLRAFKEVGYETYWISNQGGGGYYENPIEMYANEADKFVHLNYSSYGAKGALDEVLIPALEKALASPNKKFIVLHMMGSHFDFAQRYPQNFAKFQPSSFELRELGESENHIGYERLVENSYDNSIYYTDYVLSQMIMSVVRTASSALVAYVSDHGQDLIGGKCKAKSISRQSSDSYAVPAFIWVNAVGTGGLAERVSRLKRVKERPFTSKDFPQTLLDLVGLDTPGTSRGHSWFDDGTERRLVFSRGRWVDYDDAALRSACEMDPE